MTMRVRLHRWTRHVTLAGVLHRIWPRRPLVVRCVLVAVRPQYLVLRTPGGDEVWASRDDGELTGARGGTSAGARSLPPQWRGWSLHPSDLDRYWAEHSQHADGDGPRTASGARRARERSLA